MYMHMRTHTLGAREPTGGPAKVQIYRRPVTSSWTRQDLFWCSRPFLVLNNYPYLVVVWLGVGRGGTYVMHGQIESGLLNPSAENCDRKENYSSSPVYKKGERRPVQYGYTMIMLPAPKSYTGYTTPCFVVRKSTFVIPKSWSGRDALVVALYCECEYSPPSSPQDGYDYIYDSSPLCLDQATEQAAHGFLVRRVGKGGDVDAVGGKHG